ncbi:MAG TPA: hypothetical protein VMJ32_13830 [Pirellulales bacterium]|nr:hypothetical protein [Pirellulales bacterium]
MCPTRTQSPLLPIELDLSAAFSFEQGFGRAQWLQLGPQLEQARAAVLEAVAAEAETGLNHVRPQHILADYHRQRKSSLLGQILTLAKRLRETVDSVVILGPPQRTTAAHALLAACAHPYHNSLSRGQRGGRPRIFFAPAVPDNDALQALLEILPHGRSLHTIDQRWGLLAIDEHGGANADETGQNGSQLLAGLFSFLWDALQTTTTAVEETQLAAVVGPSPSPLLSLAKQIGLPTIVWEGTACIAPGPTNGRGFVIPTSDFFHPGVLLAGSVMGIDIVKLLHGAAAMWRRFAAAPPGDNPPLNLAGLRHLLAARRKISDGIKSCIIDPSIMALAPLAEQIEPSSLLTLHPSPLTPHSSPLTPHPMAPAI